MGKYRRLFAAARQSVSYWRGLALTEFIVDFTQRMDRLNLNRATIAKRRKCSRALISQVLRGDSNLTIDSLVKLAMAVDGVVHIDGVPLIEPYVRHRRPWNYAEVAVGPREYFVVGDNRGMRMADHDFGRVDARRILGPLVF